MPFSFSGYKFIVEYRCLTCGEDTIHERVTLNSPNPEVALASTERVKLHACTNEHALKDAFGVAVQTRVSRI